MAQAPRLSLRVVSGSAQITITGAVASAWSILFSTNLTSSNNWLPLASVSLTNGTQTVVDTTGPVMGRRFYIAASQQPPTNVITTNMVWIGPGSFLMGSPTNEVGRSTDETQHSVTLTQGVFFAKYLVSQGDYMSVVGNNPSYFNGAQGTNNYGTDLTRPVEQASWYAASYYCAQLTASEQAAGRLPMNWAYRLPTEAEWEFACRAGNTNRFSYGDDPGYTNLANYAWYSVNSTNSSHPVGQKLPNAWNLYDVHGDVYEWCQDWYGPYPTGPVVSPPGPATGTAKVFRGGAWYYGGKFCRSGGRYSADPTLQLNIVGFRVVAAPQ